MTCTGLPHSEIPGSKVVCTSPRLIAAYHVLHRLLVPRHPPYALCSLTKNLAYNTSDFIKEIRVRLVEIFNLGYRSIFDCQRTTT